MVSLLLYTVRRWLIIRAVAPLHLDTLRLRLLKIGGRVWQRSDRGQVLASRHPGHPLQGRLAAYRHLHE